MKNVKKLLPFLIVFITSMSIMIIELVASRMVSKYFGNSLYTWTGIIGTVLGGISLGNYLGGRLADRFRPGKLASVLLLATSFLIFLILLLDYILNGILTRGAYGAVTRGMVMSSMGVIVALFFLPAAALGTISPVMAKYALETSTTTGRTVGSIYAVSSIGSIIGTFLSGYVLIPLLGISAIVFIIGGTVALLSFTLIRFKAVSAAWMFGIAFLFVWSHTTTLRGKSEHDTEVLYETDSRYSHIEVRVSESDDRRITTLVMDGLIHNRYDPADPDDLLYEYERLFASMTRNYVDEGNWGVSGPLRTLTLGGGGCVFPSYLARQYPSGFHDVVEIDPEVIDLAEEYFDFTPSPHLSVHLEDARSFVNRAAGKKTWHIVYLDAFNSFSIPPHLTTREYTEKIAEVLEPGGLLIVNTIDILSIGRFINAYINTLKEVFPTVSVYAGTNHSPYVRNTFVLVGSDSSPWLEKVLGRNLVDGRGWVIAEKLPDETLKELRERNRDMYLSDNYAPVENLIAPVFIHSID